MLAEVVFVLELGDVVDAAAMEEEVGFKGGEVGGLDVEILLDEVLEQAWVGDGEVAWKKTMDNLRRKVDDIFAAPPAAAAKICVRS